MARMVGANVSSLVSGRQGPLPCWEEENGRERGVGSISKKKAARKRREKRRISSQ